MAIQFQRLQNRFASACRRGSIALLATEGTWSLRSGACFEFLHHARNTCGQRLIAEFFTKPFGHKGKTERGRLFYGYDVQRLPIHALKRSSQAVDIQFLLQEFRFRLLQKAIAGIVVLEHVVV